MRQVDGGALREVRGWADSVTAAVLALPLPVPVVKRVTEPARRQGAAKCNQQGNDKRCPQGRGAVSETSSRCWHAMTRAPTHLTPHFFSAGTSIALKCKNTRVTACRGSSRGQPLVVPEPTFTFPRLVHLQAGQRGAQVAAEAIAVAPKSCRRPLVKNR